ncbi:condensin-2 complex subunit D3 [Lampris incognitus]|uniref:condensin-2 complex subunit D3 n=1 Tax=Lampris incognitus TaxID=2546036 RepID=UPI0024B5FB9F|nr:condensin-2 complex subunit D3 [Lampris incognitus]
MDLISALRFLKLDQLSPAWVDTIWDFEFTEAEPLDTAIEEEIVACGNKAFKNLYKCFLPYATDSGSSTGDGENIWSLFGDNGVCPKALVAELSFFILGGKRKTASGQQRVSALQAASIYLLLLGIPGSIANQVFHQVLLDTCLDLVSHCWPQECGKKRKKEALKASQADKRSRPPRKDQEEMDEDEAEEEEEVFLSTHDLVEIREGVVHLVRILLRILHTFPFQDKPENTHSFAQVFAKLIYFEPVVGELTFTSKQDIGKISSIPGLAFYGLRLLCTPSQGEVNESLRKVFYRLLFVILMMSKNRVGRPSLLPLSHSVLQARDHALHFVCHVVEELKETAMPFLHILVQHICFQMVEKNEYRTHGAQAVGMLMSLMPSVDYVSLVKWLFNYSKHSKVVYRLFAVDVVMILLEQPERTPESLDPELSSFLSHKFLIHDLLFGRRTDISPTVRGHTLACLAQCLELPSFNATRAVHTLFSTTASQTVLETQSFEGAQSAHQTQKTYRTLPFRTVEITSSDNNIYDAKENLVLLLQRVADPKTSVRKSALQALTGLLKHGVVPLTTENLAVLSDRCRDPAISVKKKALQCLRELLTSKSESSLVQRTWLQGVVPALVDSESSVQEKALEELEVVLLNQVKSYSAQTHLDAAQRLTWDLLGLLCHECQNLSRYFSRAFTNWSKQNKITPALITNLICHTEAEHADGAWLLLAKVASSSPKIPCGKILEAWEDMVSSKVVSVTTMCHILSVVGDIAEHLNEDTKSRIIDDLMTWLKMFSMPLEVISASMETLFLLGRSEDIKQTQAFLNKHCGELVAVCKNYLATIILSETGAENLNPELMVKHLHTLGVASLHCPAQLGKRTVLLVESVLTTHRDKLAGSEDLPASLPLSQFRANFLPTMVRAHGVITLGKLCLQHEELAQKYLPVLARELEVGEEVAVRNNIVVIMCDLCVRYTNMVDHYIPNISACLWDNEAVIREQTLIMLTNLLQEEFLKWKGSLFFEFVSVLVDNVPSIASLCEYCLVHLLLKKNPTMFSQHFIECIFYFNSYRKHKAYNRFPQTDRKKTQFSLKGAQNRQKRFRIYQFLLEHFTDAQRFSVTSKINQTVLACFADKELPLDPDGANILAETFGILSLTEMKLQVMSSPEVSASGEEPEEENMAAMAKAVLQATHKKVVSQVQKKAFIENTIPIIISLKTMLEQNHSPVLRDLMAYLQVTMQDYRSEVKEFFAGDEQLAAELEYNLKMFEQEREMEQQMTGLSVVGQTNHRNPSVSVQGSPAVSNQVRLLAGFATPQPPRPLLPPRMTLTDRRRVASPASSRVKPRLGEQSKQTGAIYEPSIAMEETVITKGTVENRAISTPVDMEFNLTFGGGVSAIYSDQWRSAGDDGSILHQLSQDHQKPTHRQQWNVQSPLRHKNTKRFSC